MDFLDCLDRVNRAARISFHERNDSKKLETEETLFAAFLEEAEEFDEYWKEIAESKIFKYYTDLPHFKIYRKKAVKFWKTAKQIRFKTLEEFARDIVQRWFENPEYLSSEKWFFANMAECYCLDGMPAQTVLNTVLVMAQNEFEPTVTTAEAKKAAEYLKKHQSEILKQRDILDRYLKQQGFTGNSVSSRSMLKKYYLKQEERARKAEYLIEPDLLNTVLKQHDTKTIAAKRVAGSLFMLDKFVKYNPPVSAITELSNLISQELISDDTVSRHVKSLRAIRNSLKK